MKKLTHKANRHKCADCGITEAGSRKEGHNFSVKQCHQCKNWFCEACLIDGFGCPYCSDIISM